jgi:hypothetical protein
MDSQKLEIYSQKRVIESQKLEIDSQKVEIDSQKLAIYSLQKEVDYFRSIIGGLSAHEVAPPVDAPPELPSVDQTWDGSCTFTFPSFFGE